MSKELVKKQTVATMLEMPAVRKKVEEVVGKNSPAFISTVIQMSNQPHLKDCAPNTIIGAAMIAATMNLPVNQNLGYAYVVPYSNKGKKEAQFQMGYKGFIQLALRTNEYIAINDVPIPASVMKGFNPLTGQLDLDWDSDDGSGEIAGYACCFKLRNGFEKTIYWTKEKVEKHAKRYSFSYRKYNSGIWKDDFDSMALKTVIKAALSKYGILSIEMQKAIESDNAIINDDMDLDHADGEKDVDSIFEGMKPAEVEEVPEASEEAEEVAE